MDVYPLAPAPSPHGLGRVGDLPAPMGLSELSRAVRDRLGLPEVRFAGDPGLSVRRVAVCSGSGGGLLREFLRSGAEAFIAGDFRFHDGRDAAAAGRGLIDIGHFASEHIYMEVLADRIRKRAEGEGLALEVTRFEGQSDPFRAG